MLSNFGNQFTAFELSVLIKQCGARVKMGSATTIVGQTQDKMNEQKDTFKGVKTDLSRKNWENPRVKDECRLKYS